MFAFCFSPALRLLIQPNSSAKWEPSKTADYSNIVVLTKLVCDPKYTLNQRRYYIIGRSKGL